MAGELALLKAVFSLIDAERVLKGAKAAWAKSRWAKDASKVNEVERRIDALAHETGRLARNLAPDAVKPETDRLIDRFEKEVTDLGLTKEEAAELRKSVALQLDTSVLEPIADARRLQLRIETLERENADGIKRLTALEPLASRTLEAEKRATSAQTLASVALALAAIIDGRNAVAGDRAALGPPFGRSAGAPPPAACLPFRRPSRRRSSGGRSCPWPSRCRGAGLGAARAAREGEGREETRRGFMD